MSIVNAVQAEPFTTHEFSSNYSAPLQPFIGTPSTGYTAVSLLYVQAFQGFDVRVWETFEAEASNILAFSNKKNLTNNMKTFLIENWSEGQDEVLLNEASLTGALGTTLFSTLKKLKSRKALDSAYVGQWANETSLSHRKRCDFSLLNISKNGSIIVEVVGEMKKPIDFNLNAYSDVWLKKRLGQNVSKLAEDQNVRPFLQVLSYILDSQEGIGIFSTFEEFLFLRMDLHKKCIYMAPVIALGQRLCVHDMKPHTIQAFLYVWQLQRNENEFSLKWANALIGEASKLYSEHEPIHHHFSSVVMSSTSRDVHTKNNKQDCSVTHFLTHCEYIGNLGNGIIGTEEYQYLGKRVAVKIGDQNFANKLDVDTATLVEDEINIYHRLKYLQGMYIPRVVASGLDKWYTNGGRILITEKVGEEVSRTTDALYVGKRKLSRFESSQMLQSALQGLEQIHACNIVHCDIVLRNLRAESIDGRMHVWWLDFGMSKELGNDNCINEQLKRMERHLCVEALSIEGVTSSTVVQSVKKLL